MPTRLVVDTSVFIEGVMFDEVDWPKLTNADDVLLIVPLTVIAELDRWKGSAESRRKADRAAAVLRKIHELGSAAQSTRGAIVRPKVALRLVNDAARARFPMDLDPLRPDDRIIATAVRQRGQTALITLDKSMELRSRAHQVQSIYLPDEARLPREQDPTERRLSQAERELAQLKRRLPVLVVSSALGAELAAPISVSLGRIREPTAQEYHDRVVRRQAERPGVGSGFAQSIKRQRGSGWISAVPIRNDGSAGIARDTARAVELLRRRVGVARARYLTILPNLRVANTGTSPATNVSVQMRIPTGTTGLPAFDPKAQASGSDLRIAGNIATLSILRIQHHGEVNNTTLALQVSPDFSGSELVLSGTAIADELPGPVEWALKFSITWFEGSPWGKVEHTQGA